jgi:hypothetical protein
VVEAYFAGKVKVETVATGTGTDGLLTTSEAGAGALGEAPHETARTEPAMAMR